MNKEPRDWQEFTQKAMELAGISQVEMARQLTRKLGHEVNQSSVRSRVMTPAGRPPQPPEIELWADVLKLDGHHRAQFLRLALLERAPADVKFRLLQLEDDIARVNRRLKGEEKRGADLRALCDQLTAELAKVTSQATGLMQRLEQP